MKGLGNPSLYKEITLLVRFGWIIDQRYNPEFVSMSIGSICASIYKMHMSSVSGWNCKSGGTTELMKMIGMSVGAKHHIVKMTSFCLYSIAGHGGKAMVVAAFAFCDKSGTSDNFMNMLSGAGIIIGCIWIEVTHMELVSQFRCNGSDGYLSWLDNTLDIRRTANWDMEEVDYDIDGNIVFYSRQYFANGMFEQTVLRKRLY